jgi:predicted kinase
MQYVMLAKGLPASGKSSWSKEKVKNDQTWKRINRDDLRSMIDDGVWNPDNENFIRKVRNNLVQFALRKGFNVIVDDTNLKNDIFKEICDVAEQLNIDVIVQEQCFEIDPNEAIRRDATRQIGKVGSEVINDMYKRYIKDKPNIYKPRTKTFVKIEQPYLQQDQNLPKVLIVDLDGTISLLGDRDPYDPTKSDKDEINQPIAEIVSTMSNNNHEIFFVSGREDKYRETTVRFLKRVEEEYNLKKNWKLFMRQTGDFRKDAVIKKEIFDAQIKDQYYVTGIFDDRKQVKRMWVHLGLFVFDVNQQDQEY